MTWTARSLLLAALIPAVLAGRAPAVALTAELGFDGAFVPGRWTPVQVTVDNLPRADRANTVLTDFEGSVRIMSSGVAGENRHMLFERELNVAVNDRKRVTLYAKFSDAGPGSAVVELVDRNRRPVESAKVERKPVNAGEPLVVVVGSTESPPRFPAIGGFPKTRVATLDPDALPDRWIGYDGVALLVIPRAKERMLDKEKGIALRRWVAQGGRLLLVGGRHAGTYAGGPLGDLVPGRLDSTSEVRFNGSALVSSRDSSGSGGPGAASTDPALTVFQIANIIPRDTARTVLKAGDQPLLVAEPSGSGEVLFLASDWSPKLFQAAPVPEIVLAHVLAAPGWAGAGARLDSRFAFGVDGPAQWGLGKAASLPDPAALAALLLVYAVLVGPANFWWLSRRRRLEWAWITVPVIVTVFSLAIHLGATALRGGRAFVRRYHLVQAAAGASTGRADSLVMAYIPRNDRVTFRAPGDGGASGHTVWSDDDRSLAAAIGAMAGGNAATATASPDDEGVVSTRLTPDGASIPSKLVRQWAFDFTRYENVADLGGPVEATARLDDNGRLTVRVRNGTGAPLRDLHLVMGYGAWRVSRNNPATSGAVNLSGDLAAGDEISADLAVGADAPPARLGALDDARIADPLQRAVFRSLAATLPPGGRAGSELPACYLVARIDKVPVAIAGDAARPDEESDHTLLTVSVPVTGAAPSGVPGSARFRPLGDKSTGYSPGGEGTFALADRGSAFAAVLPATDRTLPTEAFFAFGPDEAQSSIQAEYFDFTEARWRGLDLSRHRPAKAKTAVNADDEAAATPWGGGRRSADLLRIRIPPSGAGTFANPMGGSGLVRIFQAADPSDKAATKAASVSAFVYPPEFRRPETTTEATSPPDQGATP